MRGESAALFLFDLDGTLADTLPDLLHALNLTITEEGHGTVAAATLRPVVSLGSRAMLATALSVPSDTPALDALTPRFLTHYEAGMDARTRLFEGMPQVLDTIEQRGSLWGVVTNKIERFTMPLLDRLGLLERAAAVVCGDTLAHAKPHPAPLHHACRIAGVEPPQTVYIGDSANDVVAARAARMRVALATWGYLPPEAQSAPRPEPWRADVDVARPAAVLDWVNPVAPSHAGRELPDHAP